VDADGEEVNVVVVGEGGAIVAWREHDVVKSGRSCVVEGWRLGIFSLWAYFIVGGV
jgi:hypothetical protein